MNWLAHLHLSGTDTATQIGNLLPDILSAAELSGVAPIYRRGIDLHHRIDSFTDSHPAFLTSKRRISGDLRRFGGIITDVFYDHILARQWSKWSARPGSSLDEFVQDFYDGLESHLPSLPPEAADRLARLRAEDWLRSYRDLSGISTALQRIGQRLRRPVNLQDSVRILEASYADFAADFAAFYPDLLDAVSAFSQESGCASPPAKSARDGVRER